MTQVFPAHKDGSFKQAVPGFGVLFLDPHARPDDVIRVHGGVVCEELCLDVFVEHDGIVHFGIEHLVQVVDGMVEDDNPRICIRNVP